MQAQTSSPRQANNILAWAIAAFGVALMVLLLLSFMADSRPAPTSEVAGTTSSRVAYLEFGLTSDVLWISDPSTPLEGQALFEIPHAPEYGVLPSISPTGDRFAYTALPEGLTSPGPDSPAELWVASIIPGLEPLLLAESIDLLVPPVWTPDGESLVYRRSAVGPHTLALAGVDGAEERIVAYSETEALFPVAFKDDGAILLYAGLNQDDGSRLYEVELSTGVATEVATLSPALTRDWKLSPDGTQLAFLEVAFDDASVASRASVLNLATGNVVPLTAARDVAFSPTWNDRSELAIGVFNADTLESGLLIVDGQSRATLEGPVSGFDVPLSYSAAAGAYLVRAFENDSVTAPGRSSLVLVGDDGERRTIAEGEVTLVGWTHP